MLYSGREEHLRLMLAGLQKTGVSLIEFDGTQLLPAVIDDDIGIYVLIPKLAQFLQISSAQAITLFFTAICGGAAAVSVVGLWKLYHSWAQRFIATAGVVLLTKVSMTVLDVYCIPAAIALATVPWALYFANQQKNSWGWYSFLLVAGTACGFAHYIRAHAGIAVILFILSLMIAYKKSWRSVATSCAILVCGFLPAHLYFSFQKKQYTSFVAQNLPHYAWVQPRHPLWHTIYIGLGFITNDLGLAYSDAVAVNKVKSIAPTAVTTDIGPWKDTVSTPEYDQIVRAEVLKLLRKHWFFVLRVLAAKMGVILLYLLLFANIGLLAALLGYIPWRIIIAFGCALSWSMLPGLLAIPWVVYLSGFVTFAGLFSIIGINAYLNFRSRARI